MALGRGLKRTFISSENGVPLTQPSDQKMVQYRKLHPCSANRVTVCSIFRLSILVIGLTFSPRFSRSFRRLRLSQFRAKADKTYRKHISRRKVKANAQKMTK